jgi:hypothetical protein
MPPINTPSNNSRSRVVRVVVFVLALILIGVIVLQLKPRERVPITPPVVTYIKEPLPNTKVDVAVVKTDVVASKAENRIPKGFPSDLPYETEQAIEGYTASDQNNGFSQYTFSYISKHTANKVYADYLSYMEKNEYTFGSNGKNEAAKSLYGSKNNDSLLVTMTEDTEGVKVTITFLDRS